MRMSVHVDSHGLPAKLSLFTSVEAKRAIRTAVGRAGQRGRTLVRQGAPVKTGLGRAGIRSTSVRGLSNTAVAKIYPSGPHAHIMRWQDQGTGERHNRHGASRGMVSPQYFFERGALRLDGELPTIMNAEIDKALAKAGLG
jgi:hypothetical protein